MPTWMWITIAVMVVVAVAILAAAIAVGRRKRTERLKSRFGPEYTRLVSSPDGKATGEKELVARERQRDQLDVVSLRPATRHRFVDEWHSVQTSFVDDPAHALTDADALVKAVMRERGYPVDDFDRRADDISVDYPEIVEDYRAAHAVQLSDSGGEQGTEAQRSAFVHYRALFDVLLAHDDDSSAPATTDLQGDRS